MRGRASTRAGGRADTSRHRRREALFATLAPAAGGRLPEQYHPTAEPWHEVEDRDLRQVLDDELLHLPEKYRAPVVLCDLEGRTHQEAAVELGCPTGSMSRRLERARAILRRRLVHRGVTLAIGLAGVGLAAYLAGRATHREIHHAQAVRRVMTSLEPLATGSRG